MKIADVKIKRLNWEVHAEDPKTSREKDFEVGDCGDTLFIKKKIYINSTMEDDLVYETIKHELVHAYLFSYGMGQIKFDEEVVCDFVSTYGDSIIKDSKDLFEAYKYMTEPHNKRRNK